MTTFSVVRRVWPCEGIKERWALAKDRVRQRDAIVRMHTANGRLHLVIVSPGIHADRTLMIIGQSSVTIWTQLVIGATPPIQ